MSVRVRVWCGLACALIALIGFGCQRHWHDTATNEFLRQTIPERRASILQYPLEQQVDLYLAAMRLHPPDLGLANVIASNGANVVPFLIARLGKEAGDIEKTHLISVFLEMQRSGYFRVASDRPTMLFLEQQVALLKDPFWRNQASDRLREIRAQSLGAK